MKKFTFLTFFTILLSLLFSVSALAVSISNPLQSDNIPDLLTRISNIVAGIVGALGIIMLIISGVLFVTSGGSPEKINSAKKALFYAVMGIAVSLAATAISNTIKYIIGA